MAGLYGLLKVVRVVCRSLSRSVGCAWVLVLLHFHGCKAFLLINGAGFVSNAFVCVRCEHMNLHQLAPRSGPSSIAPRPATLLPEATMRDCYQVKVPETAQSTALALHTQHSHRQCKTGRPP